MANKASDELKKLSFGTQGSDSDRRLGELMLYIADRCSNDEFLGAVKLNKLLYFTDFFAFANRRESITGAEYMSLPQGPVPRRLKYVREMMKADHSLVIRPRKVYGYTQNQLIPLREPDLSLFSGWEIALVDQILDACRGKTAGAMSEASHDRVWEIAGTAKEPIPYEAVYVSSGAIEPLRYSPVPLFGGERCPVVRSIKL